MFVTPSPKKELEKRFGTREALIKEIVTLVEADQEAAHNFKRVSNAKLLRIYDVAAEVQAKFGGKAGLIDAIAPLQFKGGTPNEGWREKMETFTVKRLFDKFRQLK